MQRDIFLHTRRLYQFHESLKDTLSLHHLECDIVPTVSPIV
jgi:hypothetical protein